MRLRHNFSLLFVPLIILVQAPVGSCFRRERVLTTTRTTTLPPPPVVNKNRFSPLLFWSRSRDESGSGSNNSIDHTKSTSSWHQNLKTSELQESDDNDVDDDSNHNNNKRRKKSYNLIIPKEWTRFLYIISSLNPMLAVVYNDYTHMVKLVSKETIKSPHGLAKTIFFFAKLKPRVSFAIGAILRGLQLTTAFQYVFDPTSGVGFGLNLLCLFAKSHWPATIVLGWSVTKQFWKVLGACPPSSKPVPITINLKKAPTTKDAKNKKSEGYRIGIWSYLLNDLSLWETKLTQD